MKYKLATCDRCGTGNNDSLILREFMHNDPDSPHYCRDCWELYKDKSDRQKITFPHFFDSVVCGRENLRKNTG